MPKTKRDFLKRHIGHTWHNIETAQGHLNTVRETFAPTHPEYAKLLELAMTSLEQTLEMIRAFATHAWGGMPQKLESWRNTGHEWRKQQKEIFSDLPQFTDEELEALERMEE